MDEREGILGVMTRRGRDPSREGPPLTVGALPYEHSEAGRLLCALHAEQVALYGFADRPDDTPPGEFALPRGEFLTARLNDATVGCGDWHLFAPGTAEVKRMYVVPAARGRGVGRRVLREIECRAAAHGVRHMLLETGAPPPVPTTVATPRRCRAQQMGEVRRGGPPSSTTQRVGRSRPVSVRGGA